MVNKKPTVALYGGTFDPPHQGHQRIVDTLVSLAFVDKVIVTPTYLNPFKDSTLAPATKRLDWCRVLFDDPKVIIDSGEVESGQKVYTSDTVDRLSREYNVKYIAIGADNLSSIDKWYNFDRLNQDIVWLVFDRHGYGNGYKKLRKYQRFTLDERISSSLIRNYNELEMVDKRIATEVEDTLNKGSR